MDLQLCPTCYKLVTYFQIRLDGLYLSHNGEIHNGSRSNKYRKKYQANVHTVKKKTNRKKLWKVIVEVVLELKSLVSVEIKDLQSHSFLHGGCKSLLLKELLEASTVWRGGENVVHD